jgi:hypothetical protein
MNSSHEEFPVDGLLAPLGGRRWWLIGPFTGRRALKLHCPQGREQFGSRQHYRLGYACQRETPRDRAFSRARKARRKIGGTDNLTLPLPPKPKGMRWRTYKRLALQAEHADRAVLANSAVLIEKWTGRKLRVT